MTPKILVYGGQTGWIGKQMIDLCKLQNIEVHASAVRIENREAVEKELTSIKPTHVLNAAGVTGRPNIDWCESHKPETMRTNVIGTLNVADLCLMHGIHCTVYATGCIFQYDEKTKFQLGSGVGFTEEDLPNFADSFYSETKGYMEQMLKHYPNCLVLRVRMPISDDLIHRNFVTKIVKYERVVNIPNSMTILHELLPVSLQLALKGYKGVYNFTNPGVISHNQVLDLYTKYIDPTYTYSNFTLEEQAKILKAGRSNNELDTTKLMAAVEEINHNNNAAAEDNQLLVVNDILTGCELVFQRMAANLREEFGGELPDCLPKEFRRI